MEVQQNVIAMLLQEVLVLVLKLHLLILKSPENPVVAIIYDIIKYYSLFVYLQEERK